MNWSSFDQHVMARVLRLAERGRCTTDPNPRVACVLAKDQQILAEAWHVRAGQAHAETLALAATDQAAGSTCYVSLEPCSHHGHTPPCAEALIEAGVRRVVIAGADPDPRVSGRGVQALRAAGVDVASGLMAAQAAELNRGFIKRMEQGLPWVRLKLALSLDGRIALANGRSQWLSSPQSRQDAHSLRAASSVIMTGIGTVLTDDPRLTVRDFDGPFIPPLRVVLDSRLRTPPTARLLHGPERTLIFTGSSDAEKIHTLETAGAEIVQVPVHNGRPEPGAVLRGLVAREQSNEVLLEAGGTLSGAFIQSGCWDELVFYLSPMLLGDRAQAAMLLPEYAGLADCPQLVITGLRQLGDDVRITARPRRA